LIVWHKRYPPFVGNIRIPVSSREEALAGTVLHAPTTRAAVALDRACTALIRIVGPVALPSRPREWTPPLAPNAWEEFRVLMDELLGGFDSVAVHERKRGSGRGFSALLLRGGTAVGFVRMQQERRSRFLREFDALQRLAQYGPKTFRAPDPIMLGRLGAWDYLVTSPLGSRHRVSAVTDLSAVTDELREALTGTARPEHAPAHWTPMHGDFTPWNLRETDEGLVLYDWERVSWGPMGADETLYGATMAALRGAVFRPTYPEAVTFWLEKSKRSKFATSRFTKALHRALVDGHRDLTTT
jgi:hypothetical protein